MPIMDGYQATQEIREFLRQNQIVQPVITAVTGHTEESYVKKCLDSGMNQVMSKPVCSKLLLNLLKKTGYKRKERGSQIFEL